MKLQSTRRLVKATLLLVFTSLSVTSWGADLLVAYNDALRNDYQFKSAQAQWLAARENLAISRASLFPQIAVQASVARAKTNSFQSNIGTNQTYYHHTANHGLTLSQSIFDLQKFATVRGAQASVRSAYASFMSEEESLLYRVAERYFDVLLAKKQLAYANSNRQATEHFLKQAKHKYEVGLSAITDLQEARRNYELAVANEVSSQNNLESTFERLAEVTQQKYAEVASLRENFPLLSPQPSNINQWSEYAERHNFALLASNYKALAARENIKVENAGHFPTITAEAGYQGSHDSNYAGNNYSLRSQAATVGVNVTLPIYSGGGVSARAKQADYLYQDAIALQEKLHREVVSNTRQAYLGVLSNVSKIKAKLQAIKAAESALKSVQANYFVGRKTMSDVLYAQTQLLEAQQEYASDEHSYILSLLTLKQLTGTLLVKDLQDINSWLTASQPSSAKHSPKQNKSSAKLQATPQSAGGRQQRLDSVQASVSSSAGQLDRVADQKVVVLSVNALEPVAALARKE